MPTESLPDHEEMHEAELQGRERSFDEKAEPTVSGLRGVLDGLCQGKRPEPSWSQEQPPGLSRHEVLVIPYHCNVFRVDVFHHFCPLI